MANVLIVNSSYRKNSNTAALTKAMAIGAQKKHNVETIEIGREHIKPCMGCGGCLKPNSNYCVQKDDMTKYYEKVAEANILILSSPIYWFNMNGQLKLFIDRLFALASKSDENINLSRKKIGAAFVYGDTDPVKSGCINALRCLQDICAYSQAQWLGAVYGAAEEEGAILKQEKIIAQAQEFGANL